MFNMTCGSFEQIKNMAHILSIDSMTLSVSFQVVPLLKNCNLRIPDNKMRSHSHCNASFECVLNMFNSIRTLRKYWLFHTLHCFNFKHVLHRTSSMQFGTIMHKKNHQLLQRQIRHEASVFRLYGSGLSKCHSKIYAGPCVHLC